MKILAITSTVAALVGATKAQDNSYYSAAKKLIYRTFPPNTRDSAMRVAACESVNFTDFYNESSGAKGVFQEMPGNDGRVFYLGRRSIKLNWARISSHMPDLHAVQVAYFQSHGGYNWNEWSCRP